MKKRIQEIFQEKFNLNILKTYIILIVFYIIILIWKRNALPPQIPLFYSLPKGNEQLGTPITFLLLPFFSLIIFITNTIIASFLYKQEKMAAILLILFGFVSTLLFIITFAKIVFTVS
jgi:hypothetical protein